MRQILVVDDEPMIRKGLEKLLQQCSGETEYRIRTAADGEEALRLIGEECPDFLFTDIRMPKMDGLELCRVLSGMGLKMQIVVISGYGDFEYAQKSMSYGVKEYLLKPVAKAVLQETLGKLEAALRSGNKTGYVSVAKLDEWMERMEEAVWTLDRSALIRILEECWEELRGHQLSISELGELLEGTYKLLIKKLHIREFTPSRGIAEVKGVSSPEEAYESFSAQVVAVLEELRGKRKFKAKDPVEEAKAYIEKNLAQEVSLEEVAEVLGLNASYFSQLFKQATGETFVHYRIRRRMEKAKKLLQLPHYRITDISYEVGYADHPHFTKTFKKYTGQSPSEYRSSLGIE